MSRPVERRNSQFDTMGGIYKTNPGMTQTTITETMYVRILTEWASTRFKWENLPPEIDHRFLEQLLFYNSFALFYKSSLYGKFMAVRAALHGPLDVYDNAVKFRTVGNALYKSVELGKDKCVPIWGSYTRIPARDVVLLYAKKLADIDTSLTLNAKALRYTKVVKATEGQRLTYTNMMRQIDEGVPVLYLEEGYNTDVVEVLDLGSEPENLSELRMEKNQVWNEAMTLLGITNANQDKKERLVAAEATGADGQVVAARNAAMKPRQEACDRINEMFKLNISVVWDMEKDSLGVSDDDNDNENPADDVESNPSDDEDKKA